MTKIDIISGFLGAGKTTLIKKLLEEAVVGERVVLIENEFGEIGIDGGFLKNSGIEIREMNSGCICCSLAGDFGQSLSEVLTTYHPDRVIIEPSGVGKLSDVKKAVEEVAGRMDVTMNSAVTIVDAVKCKMYMKNFGEFFNDQIEHAGTIVLSRTDLATKEKVQQAIELIRGHNQTASVITTPLGQLSGAQLLELMEKPDTMVQDMIAEVEEHHCHDGNHCGCGHHHAEEVFTSWGMETITPISRAGLEGILEELADGSAYGDVLRAKGMLPGEIAGQWLYFDLVPDQFEIRIGAPDHIGKVCVIGAKLKEEKLNQAFGRS